MRRLLLWTILSRTVLEIRDTLYSLPSSLTWIFFTRSSRSFGYVYIDVAGGQICATGWFLYRKLFSSKIFPFQILQRLYVYFLHEKSTIATPLGTCSRALTDQRFNVVDHCLYITALFHYHSSFPREKFSSFRKFLKDHMPFIAFKGTACGSTCIQYPPKSCRSKLNAVACYFHVIIRQFF